MVYLEAILILFAIVDPVGNIPIFINISGQLPQGQSRKVFDTSVIVGVIILLIFSVAGTAILNHVFQIKMADLQLAGGLLLLLIAIDDLIFGTFHRSLRVRGNFSAHEFGCVPLACPLLAGPGAMVTSLTTWQKSGPLAALLAIAVVFGMFWVILRFIEPIHKLLGRLVCVVVAKVMCLFVAAIGMHMMMAGLMFYFGKG